MKSKMIQTLIKVLEYENRMYKELIEISSQKTDVVIQGNIEVLKQLIEKEQQLVAETKKLEQAREQILTQLSNAFGITPEEITLQDLIEHLDQEDKKAFNLVREKLQKTVIQLQYKNNLNQKLLENSLEYVQFSMNLITESGIQGNNYAKSGHQNGTQERKNYLDIKY